MKFRARTTSQLADMICGNFDQSESVFIYRSSSYLTRFFQDADTDYEHDGSTRALWVQSVLEEILENEPRPDAGTPPDAFLRVIVTLMDQGDALNEDHHRPKALSMLNAALAREGFEAFYAEDKKCYLRRTDGNRSVLQQVLPHRPFSKVEQEKRDLLEAFLKGCSEDQLIEEVMLPLLRQLGFQRISVAGHKDKALEYGKDLWMRYVLPTQHVLYFGIQAKKGKLDASGRSTENIAEIMNQTTMMLGHEIFDPEVSRRVLVDHAYIVAGGEITKAARNWLGERLDATKRSHAPVKHPVIIVCDNDDGPTFFGSAGNLAGKKISKKTTDPFYYLGNNLYLVKVPEGTPATDRDMEDLFDPALLATKVGGKPFDKKKSHGDDTAYGKEIFANQVVRPNWQTVNFANFIELLERIDQCIVDYSARTAAGSAGSSAMAPKAVGTP